MKQQTRTSEILAADGLDRRQLLRGSLGFFGAFPLCCSTPRLNAESIGFEGGALRIDLRKAPELREAGSAAAIVDEGRKLNLILARTGKNGFVALNRACTHGGAPCTYNHKRRTLQCTSLNHAEYDLRGALLHGRTHGDLRAYEVRRAGTFLEIRLQG